MMTSYNNKMTSSFSYSAILDFKFCQKIAIIDGKKSSQLMKFNKISLKPKAKSKKRKNGKTNLRKAAGQNMVTMETSSHVSKKLTHQKASR